MRILLSAALLCLMALPAFAQGRTMNVNIDAIENVELGDEGRRVIRFRTEHPGRLRYDIFAAPESTGAISVSFREQGDDDGDTASTLPLIAPPGRYEAVVQAVNPGAALVQMRVWLDLPLDEFESNDTRETAYRVDVPFEGIVHINRTDRDWFRVDTHGGGILGVHLRLNGRVNGPRLAIYDHTGEQIFISDDDQWGTAGMRYVRTTGRPMYIEVWDTGTWGDDDVWSFKTLIIREYRPEGAPSSNNPLVTLSVEGDTSASFQLDLIGRAIGVDTVAADEADAVARELRVAIEGRSGGYLGWVIGLLVLIALGVAGFFGWRRWGAAKSAP